MRSCKDSVIFKAGLSNAKVKVKVKSFSRVRLFATPWAVPCTRLLRSWDFLGKSTGVGCHFLLQGIFPTQGSNPGLSHCRQTLYHLSHQAEPKKNRCHSNQINTVPILKDSCTVLCFYNLLSLTKYVKLNYNHLLCNSFLE